MIGAHSSASRRWPSAEISRLRSSWSVVEACGDTPQRSYVLGAIEVASGRLQRGEDLMADGIAQRDEGAPEGLNGRAAAGLATVSIVLGHWEKAVDPARVAVDQGERGWAPYALAMCLSQLDGSTRSEPSRSS